MSQDAERPEIRTGSKGGMAPGLTREAISQQLNRILGSPLFAHAGKRTLLLRFIVEHALGDESERLKENEVGRQVFDRPVSYDPRLDPIVRVQVSNLRSKLREYYASEGKDDPLLIEIPRGAYLPRFERRSTLQIVESSQPESRPIRPARGQRGQRRGVKTIAVLPFVDLSPGGVRESLCDGVTEEIIDALAQLKQVHVVARTSAFQFKGKSVDVRQVGAQLNVQAVLEASLQREEDRLRVVARVTSVDTGFVLWSAEFDQQVQDVFTIEEEIANAIVKALKIKLGGSQQQRLSLCRYKANTELYELYLLGRYHWNRPTAEALQKSVAIFQQIIAQDASYAPAYAGLADSYLLLGLFDLVAPNEVMPKARAAAKKALELDDTLAAAYTSLGSVLALLDWQWAKAQRMYQRAIHFNPGYVPAHHYRALFILSSTRGLAEAMDELQKAIRLDPLSLVLNANSAAILWFAGRPDEAIAQCRKTIDLDPGYFRSYWVLGHAYEQKGMYPEAIRSLQKAQELAGDATFVAPLLSSLAYVHALSGNHDQARRYIQELESRARQKYISPFWIAMAYAGLDDRDQVFAWLERACDIHDAWLWLLPILPIIAPLKSHERYRALLHRIRLA
ncbi:MAG: hypothetical protein ACLQBJ_11605 [Bryobacteraceae bacterium]